MCPRNTRLAPLDSRRDRPNASCDTFYIKVSGKGGHGAHPENCIDPIAISGYIMAQLQTVVSRENHPVYPAVMTIGSIHGGKAPNVIPDFVEMSGTLRSLNAESREKMQAAIDRICISCAGGYERKRRNPVGKGNAAAGK